MAYKMYDFKTFSATVNNFVYTFTCCYQNTRYGFRHLCTAESSTGLRVDTKACYYNRTWERFQYESVLVSAIKKISPSENVLKTLMAILVDKTAKDEAEAAKLFINSFEKEYNKLPKPIKKTLPDSNIMLETEEQATAMLNTMKMINVINGIGA